MKAITITLTPAEHERITDLVRESAVEYSRYVVDHHDPAITHVHQELERLVVKLEEAKR